MKKPNILWLIAEDMCPNLGCYGDVDAITPRLDQLAKEGMRYNQVSSCGPVCSAARTTLALGMYPSSVGTGNHRSCVKLPDYIKIFAEFMQEVGYYTAINKTDYNFELNYDGDRLQGWDTSIKSEYFADTPDLAKVLSETWNQREEGKPFFFMHTYAITHQSKYGFPSTPDKHRETYLPRIKPSEYQNRETLHVPKYHPDNKETREIWGQYHETVTTMDRMVGEAIDQLKAENLYEDTIIFFFGDNGMGIPSGKFSMWNEGISVPLIVRVPDKYKGLVSDYSSGSVSEKPITFVDFAPTALNLGGAKVPEYMQGHDFLTSDKAKYTYNFRNRIDCSCDLIRSIKTDKYLYIRNFYPQKGWRFSPYIAISAPYFTSAWEEEVKNLKHNDYNRLTSFFKDRKPEEELYDLVNDPDQMNNLVADTSLETELHELRHLLIDEMIKTNDGGLFPEHELKKLSVNQTSYDVLTNKKLYPIEEILNICNQINDCSLTIEEAIILYANENPVIRYWAMQGIYALGKYTDVERAIILEGLEDESEMIALTSAETILMLSDNEGDTKLAKDKLISFLTNVEDVFLPLEAAVSIDRIGIKCADLVKHTKHLIDEDTVTNEINVERYVQAVIGIAKYYAEVMDLPHEYIDPNDWYNQRLFELRKLKI